MWIGVAWAASPLAYALAKDLDVSSGRVGILALIG